MAENPVQQFFDCISNQDLSGALERVHDDTVFEAQGPSSVPIYGRFEGKDGVRKFLGILAEMFETEVFEIRQWSTADERVFAYGYMQHRVRKTGRVVKCEWALVCQVSAGRIASYKMFEDTAALQAAYTGAGE